MASLIQVIVVAYMVLEAKWSGWKIAGALFLVVLNVWVQAAIESVPYFRARGFQGHVAPGFATQAVVTGLVTAALFAPFAVWILGGLRRAAGPQSCLNCRVSAARSDPNEHEGTAMTRCFCCRRRDHGALCARVRDALRRSWFWEAMG